MNEADRVYAAFRHISKSIDKHFRDRSICAPRFKPSVLRIARDYGDNRVQPRHMEQAEDMFNWKDLEWLWEETRRPQ